MYNTNMGSAWQEWKKHNAGKQKEGKVSPLDFINPDTEYAPVDEIQRRMSLCEGCEHYLISKQCSQCGCFMPLKTRLAHAVCPIDKW